MSGCEACSHDLHDPNDCEEGMETRALARERALADRLAAALPPAWRLRGLAEWLDKWHPNEDDPVVQRDLRAYADAIDAATQAYAERDKGERGVLEWWYEVLVKALSAQALANALVRAAVEGNANVGDMRDAERDK